jgi:endogenous inhibitor of DNA gyrase (YacG/DUF329 family)
MAIEKLCPQCGKSHEIRRSTKVYCSPKCRDLAAYARKQKLHKQEIENDHRIETAE